MSDADSDRISSASMAFRVSTASVLLWGAINLSLLLPTNAVLTPPLTKPTRRLSAECISNSVIQLRDGFVCQVNTHVLGPYLIGTEEDATRICVDAALANQWETPLSLTLFDRTCNCNTYSLSTANVLPGNAARLQFDAQIAPLGGITSSYISFSTHLPAGCPEQILFDFAVESYPRMASSWVQRSIPQVTRGDKLRQTYCLYRHLAVDEADPGVVVSVNCQSGRVAHRLLRSVASLPHSQVRRLADTYEIVIEPSDESETTSEIGARQRALVEHKWCGSTLSVDIGWMVSGDESVE